VFVSELESALSKDGSQALNNAYRRSRPQRWNDAVAQLLALQVEYTAWADALPDALRDTATAEALQAVVDLDLSDIADIEPPRGYGRD